MAKVRGRRARVATAGVLLVCTLVTGSVLVAPAEPAQAALDTTSPLYADRVLVRSYQTLFNRKVTAAGSTYWYARLIGRPDAAWFARALMASAEYRLGAGALPDRDFISRMYLNSSGRPATASDTTFWLAAFANRSQNRATMVAWIVENRFTFKLRRPDPGAPCARYNRGGPTARCEIGSAGTQRDVDVLAVPRTNLRVNKAWYFSVLGLVEAARAAGYDLQGSLDPTVPSWMVTPGSWRSFEEQQWLYQNGFPANPPGKSMHEWGLAMDLDCNGHAIVKVRGCWNWVRTNGPAHGVYLFHKVDDMTDSEAWHFSSNAL